jgi:hypothetical protein
MSKGVAKAAVVNLFRRGGSEEDEEVQIGPAVLGRAADTPQGPELPSTDGKTPLVLLVGAGKTGKSTFARWYGGVLTEQGRAAIIGAVDAGNRTIARFFDGVQQPTVPDPADPSREVESRDPAVMARWFRSFLDYEIATPTPAIMDMGGNDRVLANQLAKTPDLVAALEAAGVAPVLLVFVGPRLDDLDAVATLEGLSFQPRHTALLVNHGTVDSTRDPVEAFAPIRRHRVFRNVVERGAAVVEMPALDPDVADAIERKVLHFAMARDGKVPAGRKVAPLGGLDRSHTRAWMDRMEAAFGPLIRAKWLP